MQEKENSSLEEAPFFFSFFFFGLVLLRMSLSNSVYFLFFPLCA